MQNGQCCAVTCSSCILYFRRGRAFGIGQMTVSSGGIGAVVLTFQSDCVESSVLELWYLASV